MNLQERFNSQIANWQFSKDAEKSRDEEETKEEEYCKLVIRRGLVLTS